VKAIYKLTHPDDDTPGLLRVEASATEVAKILRAFGLQGITAEKIDVAEARRIKVRQRRAEQRQFETEARR
jgi:hypothetical protein